MFTSFSLGAVDPLGHHIVEATEAKAAPVEKTPPKGLFDFDVAPWCMVALSLKNGPDEATVGKLDSRSTWSSTECARESL